MKKLLLLLVCTLLLLTVYSVTAQNIDLSQYSYVDLQNIAAQAQMEMMERPEFQEVEVPTGLYVVGKEIPAGQWTVTRTGIYSSIVTGDTLDSTQNSIANSKNHYSKILNDETPTYKITLLDGMYVQIIKNPIIFSSPIYVPFSFK